MEPYEELNAEMKAIQQQMVETKKNERANALQEIKHLCKEFGFTAGMLTGYIKATKNFFIMVFANLRTLSANPSKIDKVCQVITEAIFDVAGKSHRSPDFPFCGTTDNFMYASRCSRIGI